MEIVKVFIWLSSFNCDDSVNYALIINFSVVIKKTEILILAVCKLDITIKVRRRIEGNIYCYSVYRYFSCSLHLPLCQIVKRVM